MIDMTLPWPPKELSPNARVHWRQKHKHAKAYRRTCGLIALALGAPRLSGKKYFWVTFCPPNRRSYDDDHLLSRFKAGR
ncbi:endodeoxyribonuclease RusA, partial [Pseudomonas simiae]|uniref:endodeoxyribonuclease RusA n=1 Tax=Pseudomonas simiae TaxID=321846 RepID=UPI00209467C8